MEETQGQIVLTLAIEGDHASAALDVEESLPAVESLMLIREGVDVLVQYALQLGQTSGLTEAETLKLIQPNHFTLMAAALKDDSD
ncbi:MAG TPA: hypothetical protein VGB55_13775 [Tepidisphaeraceae bacterium]|jgi:hypothetical protein